MGFSSRRWAGRTPSRELRQKQWTPPDLSQRPQRPISTYSEKDYIIGDSTPSALRRIASLLTNGPSPKETSRKTAMQENNDTESVYKLPTAPVELASNEAYNHKKTEAPESTAYELQYPPPAGPVELEGIPTARVELWGSNVTVEKDRRPLPQIKLSSQEPIQRADASSFWNLERGKRERLQTDEWLSSYRTRKVRKP